MMKVVIATAEPRGSYHLAPLSRAVNESDAVFTHLVPYPEPTQGYPYVQVSSDTSVLDDADRVVVTGGTLSAWTELVAREANSREIPVIYSELSWTTGKRHHSLPRLSAVSALTPSGASSVANVLGADRESVFITGIPALDDAPPRSAEPGSVLVLSTIDAPSKDPAMVLRNAAALLRDSGVKVRVRCHPREDPALWAGFEIVANETQVVSASRASVVIGYPGSAHVLAAAVGAPVVSVETSSYLAAVLSPEEKSLMSATVSSVDEVLEAVRNPVSPSPAAIESVVGPVGDASRSMVSFWTRPISL
jgi:hypothetical protein